MNCNDLKPGYSFVIEQEFGDTYPPEKALERGTMFPILDLPKYGPADD